MNYIESVKCIRHAIKDDADLAWAWHCNIVMPFIDKGMDPRLANEAAANFMHIIFDIDTSKLPFYKASIGEKR